MRCMLLCSVRAEFTTIVGGYIMQRYCCLNGKPWEMYKLKCQPIYVNSLWGFSTGK